MGCASSQIKQIKPEMQPQQTARNQKAKKGKEIVRVMSFEEEEELDQPIQKYYVQNKQTKMAVHKNKFQKRREQSEMNSPPKIIIPVTYNEKKQKPKNHHQKMVITEITEAENPDQQDTFINSIMQKSRSNMIQENPSIPHKNNDFLKPVIQYNKNNKGKILSNDTELSVNDKWNTPIASVSSKKKEKQNLFSTSGSYIGINQPAKSPGKSRVIEKRIRDIKIQSVESIESM